MMMRALGIAAALAAAPAVGAEWTANGFQAVATFEDVDVGAMESCDDMFSQCVSGGTVREAGDGFTARSGARFMVGTDIGTPQFDLGVTMWPALGAWVQGAGPVTASFYGGQYGDLTLLATFDVAAGAEYTFVGFDNADAQFSLSLLEMRLTSATAFAVDDVTFGLPEQVYGVPEPAAWALMIVGFGMVGGALRRGRGAYSRRHAPA